jgi:hypothetical protein
MLVQRDDTNAYVTIITVVYGKFKMTVGEGKQIWDAASVDNKLLAFWIVKEWINTQRWEILPIFHFVSADLILTMSWEEWQHDHQQTDANALSSIITVAAYIIRIINNHKTLHRME